MKIRTLAMMALVSLLLSACSASRYYVDPEWAKMPKPASVKVVFSTPEIGNPDDLKDDLPEYEDNFVDWFAPQMKRVIDSCSNGKIDYSMMMVEPKEFKFRTEKMNETNKNFDVPEYPLMKSDADVYLVVSNIWLGREELESNPGGWVMGPSGTMVYTAPTTTRMFVSKGRYAFYDAKTKKLLGFGAAEGSMTYNFAVTRTDWENSVRVMTKQMLRETPLLGR